MESQGCYSFDDDPDWLGVPPSLWPEPVERDSDPDPFIQSLSGKTLGDPSGGFSITFSDSADWPGALHPCRTQRPRCWPLLVEPGAVLTVKDRWPGHLCQEFPRESVAQWCSRYLPEAAGAQQEFEWPLPLSPAHNQRGWPLFIEPETIAAALCSYKAKDGATRDAVTARLRHVEIAAEEGSREELVLYAPDGTGYVRLGVALALRVALPSGGALDLFGLALRQNLFERLDADRRAAIGYQSLEGFLLAAAGGRVFQLASLAAVVRGGPEAVAEAGPIVLRARRWWAGFAGQRPLPGGFTRKRNRPPAVSEADYRSAYWQWGETYGSRPRQADLAAELDISEATVKKYARNWG
jgi:hypothetical protein